MSDVPSNRWLWALGAFAFVFSHPATVSFMRYVSRVLNNDLEPSLVISDICVYPIKGCRGFHPTKWPYNSRGFLFDREWMFINGSTNRFISQREYACLSLIQVELVGPRSDSFDVSPTHLRLSIYQNDSHPAFLHKIRTDFSENTAGPMTVSIWKDSCEAFDEGDDVSLWITDYVRTYARQTEFEPPESIRLVRMSPTFLRQTDMKYSVQGDNTGFSDGFPFLVASNLSLEDLNSKLASSGSRPVAMDRFRPNITIDGGFPFQEDIWKHVDIGGDTFRFVKKCSRCRVTTIDQDTAVPGTPYSSLGQKQPEPLHTLSLYRADKKKGDVYFGMNVIPDRQCNGEISVGAEVCVIE
eukprot:TRINITY_DN3062_c0_g2_i1.p1 TRINITY_DN3062_c0_g2~~TRINITY_DN3062_c0_g2_i1.p1  ORF type:complete len:354 (-),score=52.46 TRINITY_DN3062_c0_g2_i1:90-1151(-)